MQYVYCKVGASDLRYSRCRNRARVGLSVGISVTVNVPSNKVRVVIFLTKNVVKIISLVSVSYTHLTLPTNREV